MLEKYLRLPAVEEFSGLKRSAIYDGVAKGTFPKPVRIGRRAVAWPERVLREWQSNRPSVALGQGISPRNRRKTAA